MSQLNKIMRVRDSNGKTVGMSVDELIARGLNHWRGFICGAGSKNLYIDYDGNLWRCNTASSMRKSMIRQSIPYSKENLSNHKGLLGNINENFNIPTDWFKCQWANCACGADVLIPKATENQLDKLLVNGTHPMIDHDHRPIIDDEIGPTAAVETYFKVGKQVLWDIGRRCNFACSYCWPGSHNNSDPHLDWDVIIKTSEQLINNWASGDEIRWYFGGGEPTIHPQFLDWMKWLKDRGQCTLVTTNASRPSKYWKSIVPYLDGINISVHFEYINEAKILDNIREICDHYGKTKKGTVEIKLMSTSASLQRAIDFRQSINESGLLSMHDRINGSVSLVPIRGLESSDLVEDYTAEQLAVIAKQ